jgi:HEPN domain-containing protein
MKTSKRVEIPRANANIYLGMAQQFVHAARRELDAGHADASLLAAVHAAISAADAITVASAGERSTDSDHMRLVDRLQEHLGSSAEVRARARQLGALLGKKNLVEYEARRATLDEARDGLARALRLVEWSGEVVKSARV